MWVGIFNFRVNTFFAKNTFKHIKWYYFVEFFRITKYKL